MKPGGEHAVRDRLRVNVGKLVRRQGGQQICFEALVLTAQTRPEVRVVSQSNADLVFDDRCLGRHNLGELRSRPDADRLLLGEQFELPCQLIELVGHRLKPAEWTHEIGD
jgi:hypothetical protein